MATAEVVATEVATDPPTDSVEIRQQPKGNAVLLPAATTAVIGGLGGSVVATIRGQPVVPFAAAVGSNFGLVSAMFLGLRSLLCQQADSNPLASSMAAATLTGMLVSGLQARNVKIMGVSGLFAGAVGGVGQVLYDEYLVLKKKAILKKRYGELVPETAPRVFPTELKDAKRDRFWLPWMFLGLGDYRELLDQRLAALTAELTEVQSEIQKLTPEIPQDDNAQLNQAIKAQA